MTRGSFFQQAIAILWRKLWPFVLDNFPSSQENRNRSTKRDFRVLVRGRGQIRESRSAPGWQAPQEGGGCVLLLQ